MVELTVKSGDKNRDSKTVAVDLAEAGFHIYTDKGFFDRQGDIKDFFQDYLTDDEIKNMNLSKVREDALKRTMRIAKLVYLNSSYGKGRENPRLLKAMNAVSDFILANEVTVASGLSDDDVALICRARTAKFRNVVPATFDSANTTVNKSFMVNSPTGMFGARGNEGLDEDTKEDMLWIRQQRQAQQQK